FKGSLTSRQAGNAMRKGLLERYPGADITVVPVADGGEGTVEALAGRKVRCTVANPLLRPISAEYAIAGHTAIIEMAAACGLTLLTPAERNPLRTSSYGFGQMIAHAWQRGIRHFLIGLGGSATCDGGLGMLSALGMDCGTSRPDGACMEAVESISGTLLCSGARFDIACDVDNPFYGPEGAACVFAPQKGASPQDVASLDRGLRNLASVILRQTGTDVQAIPGAGAAGGTGGAMAAFLGARIRNGAETVLGLIGFDSIIRGADLIVTGEGCLDSQTLRGKLPAGVLAAAKRMGIPVIAVGGRVEALPMLLKAGFSRVVAATPPGQPLDEAMREHIATANIINALRI
ncbi:MAG: glycerate kinase, partial [Muribaculaceae bacterium]|nr:glycerate kinase [Muribaculaceae bacterium]